MIIYHQSNVAAFAGNHTTYWPLNPIGLSRISVTSAAPTGRIMSSMVGPGGLAAKGGLAGEGGGLAA